MKNTCWKPPVRLIGLVLLSIACIIVAVSAYDTTIGLPVSYDGWSTVEIMNCGTIKIPKTWEFNEKSGSVIISQNGITLFSETSELHSVIIKNTALANSAEYGIYKDSEGKERCFFTLYSPNRYFKMISCEDVELAVTKKIAKSFKNTGDS